MSPNGHTNCHICPKSGLVGGQSEAYLQVGGFGWEGKDGWGLGEVKGISLLPVLNN